MAVIEELKLRIPFPAVQSRASAGARKTLIFTQYRGMGDLLVKFIKQKFGAETLFLHGGVSRKRRDEMVESFQNERANKIFILSLKAGGTGLNLTAASNVIHYDLWWNPAVETQATDRATASVSRKTLWFIA